MKATKNSIDSLAILPFEVGNLMVLSQSETSVIATVRIIGIDESEMMVVMDDESTMTFRGKVNCDLFRSDAIYHFTGQIGEKNEPGSFSLSHITDIKRIQRRNNVRLNLEGSIVYRKISDSDSDSDGEWYFSDMLNVSASGMLITCADNLHEQEYVAVNAELFRSLGVRKPVLATTNRLSRRKNQVLCGLSFITRSERDKIASLPADDTYAVIDEGLANRIGHFIFTRQIEYRNTGRDL